MNNETKKAFTALETGLQTFCAGAGITSPWTKGLDQFVATPIGKRLKAEYDAAAAAPATSSAATTPEMASEDDSRATAFAALESGLSKFCAEQKIAKVWTDGLEQYRRTDEGRRLSDNYNDAD